MSMKNSNDTIGNRTSDLPVFSAVPQSTALPGVPTADDKRTSNIVNIDTFLKLFMIRFLSRQIQNRRSVG